MKLIRRVQDVQVTLVGVVQVKLCFPVLAGSLQTWSRLICAFHFQFFRYDASRKKNFRLHCSVLSLPLCQWRKLRSRLSFPASPI